MTQRIYVISPPSTWDTDRYETLIYLIFHEFAEDLIIEQRDTPECPKGVATVIFIRGENRCIGLDAWTTLNLAYASGKTVKLARMDRDGLLVLVPWRQLEFTVQDDGVQVGYAKPAAKKREKVEVN